MAETQRLVQQIEIILTTGILDFTEHVQLLVEVEHSTEMLFVKIVPEVSSVILTVLEKQNHSHQPAVTLKRVRCIRGTHEILIPVVLLVQAIVL